MKPERSFASASDVARLAGVSRSAVSRAFTPGASIAEATRQRVMTAAKDLGYHVNHLARGLMRQKSGIVCLIVSDVDTPFQSRLARTLIGRLQQAGKVTMVINSSGSAEDVARAVRQTLDYRADATIVLSGTPDRSIARTCLGHGQNLILINRDQDFDEAHTITVANIEAARQAVLAFTRAGCRRLACVASEAGTPSLVAREQAFLRLVREAGLEPLSWRGGRTNYEAGVAAAHSLFTRAVMPDAAFCISDLVACGFMDAARRDFGLCVPRDVCVIGFDDIDEAGWKAYDLTTFSQPVGRFADRVIEIVEAPDEERKAGTRVCFDVPLVWRSSVRKPGPAG